MRKIRRKPGSLDLDRRTFIKTAAVTTAAIGCSPVLSSCGGSSSDGPSLSTKSLHFDLSHLNSDEEFTLHMGAGGATCRLEKHTDQTRQLYKSMHTDLTSLLNSELTHYVEDVEHPEHVTLQWVTHTKEINGKPCHLLALAGIHIPATSLSTARVEMSAEGLTSTTEASTTDIHLNPLDAAKTLVFHHPELMNLDPDYAAQIMVYIEKQNPGPLYDLALEISAQGEDGWATHEPLLDEDDQPIEDDDGNIAFHYVLSERTLASLGPAIQAVLREIKNDKYLEGISWTAPDGTSAIVEDNYDEIRSAALLATAGGADHYGLDFVRAQAGMTSKVLSVDGSTVELASKNWWLRWLGFYVQYLDIDGNVLTLDVVGKKGFLDGTFDTADAQLLGIIPGPYSFMGLPVTNFLDLATDDISDAAIHQLDIPEKASSIRLLYGGLGPWGEHNLDLAKLGITMTILMQYIIPIIMLILGSPGDGPVQSAYRNIMTWIKDATSSTKVIAALVAAIALLETIFSVLKGSAVNAVTSFTLKKGANVAAKFLLNKGVQGLALDALRQQVFTGESLTALTKAVPFAGWGLYALGSIATLAEMAETTVEVMMSPMIIENKLTRTHQLKVTVKPDPRDYQFPATATHYRLTAIFSGKNQRVIERALTTTADEINETFQDVPAGGFVEIIAAFYSATEWLAGKGSCGSIENISDPGSDTLTAPPFEIEEFLVPLSLDSVYSHKQKLAYEDGAHLWVQSTAPLATHQDLSCSNVGANLCGLDSISINQKNGMLGYGWRASGQGVSECASGATGQLHTVQNVYLGSNPDEALKFTGCGYSERPQIVYDLLGEPEGRHFFIEPSYDEYHLRKIVLDNSTSFDQAGEQSYGRFSISLDSAAVHPNGYVVGVNWLSSKIAILKVSEQPYPDDEAPYAALFSGVGTRRGLVEKPCAVAVGADGTIFVLEEGNNRVSTFDLRGNPIPQFGIKTYFFSLKTDPSDVTYLDMGVESKGYLYVLFHTGLGSSPADYYLDIYQPNGDWLVRTSGMAAAKMTVDLWRNVYTLNYETFAGPGGRLEPSVSEWIPPTPSAEMLKMNLSRSFKDILKSFVRRHYV